MALFQLVMSFFKFDSIMLSPTSNTFPSVAGFKPVLSNHKPRLKSYAQAVTSSKVSLLHTDLTSVTNDKDSSVDVLQTRIYRNARNKNALMFDISKCKPNYTDQQCMVMLVNQHPNTHGCNLLNDGPKRYMEVYIDKQKDSNDIINKGIVFDDIKLTVLPCLAVDDSATIIHLKLSHLPMFTKDIVLEGLKNSLRIFGNVLDIGIFTEKASGLFYGLRLRRIKYSTKQRNGTEVPRIKPSDQLV